MIRQLFAFMFCCGALRDCTYGLSLQQVYLRFLCFSVVCVQCLVWLRFILIAVAGVRVVGGCPLRVLNFVHYVHCIKIFMQDDCVRCVSYYRNRRIRCSRRWVLRLFDSFIIVKVSATLFFWYCVLGTGKMRNAENRERVKCGIRLAEKYCGT